MLEDGCISGHTERDELLGGGRGSHGRAGIEAAGMANQRMMELQKEVLLICAPPRSCRQRRLKRQRHWRIRGDWSELAASQERFQEEKAKLLRESEEATAKAKEVAAAAAAEKAGCRHRHGRRKHFS